MLEIDKCTVLLVSSSMFPGSVIIIAAVLLCFFKQSESTNFFKNGRDKDCDCRYGFYCESVENTCTKCSDTFFTEDRKFKASKQRARKILENYALQYKAYDIGSLANSFLKLLESTHTQSESLVNLTKGENLLFNEIKLKNYELGEAAALLRERLELIRSARGGDDLETYLKKVLADLRKRNEAIPLLHESSILKVKKNYINGIGKQLEMISNNLIYPKFDDVTLTSARKISRIVATFNDLIVDLIENDSDPDECLKDYEEYNKKLDNLKGTLVELIKSILSDNNLLNELDKFELQILKIRSFSENMKQLAQSIVDKDSSRENLSLIKKDKNDLEKIEKLQKKIKEISEHINRYRERLKSFNEFMIDIKNSIDEFIKIKFDISKANNLLQRIKKLREELYLEIKIGTAEKNLDVMKENLERNTKCLQAILFQKAESVTECTTLEEVCKKI